MSVDPVKRLELLFPNLSASGYRITSPSTREYNCIAWAAGDSTRWWDPTPFPRYYWPQGVSLSDTVAGLVRMFESIGFALCDSEEVEESVDKIAIYGDRFGYTHAARQLPDGKWTSKVGGLEDICHDTLEALTESDYGEVRCLMMRPQEEPNG